MFVNLKFLNFAVILNNLTNLWSNEGYFQKSLLIEFFKKTESVVFNGVISFFA